MKHAVLYIPGLGDHRSRGQEAAVWLWQAYGVHTEVVRMQWLVNEPYDIKLARVLSRIDTLDAAGFRVSLVGVSAGASAAINTFAVRQNTVARVVCICGKLRRPETVSTAVYERNPGFERSMQRLGISLESIPADNRGRILSIRPLADETVPPKDTIIDGAYAVVLPTVEHSLSIGLAITLFGYAIVRFIKQAD